MGRLGIIAASGTLPATLANACVEQGENPFIICLTGQVTEKFNDFETAEFAPGQLKAVTNALRAKECDRVLLAGKFTRPSLAGLRLDSAGAALLGRLALKGDDEALRLIAEHFARHQIRILPNTDFMPDRILPKGYHFGRALSENEKLAIARGISVLTKLGTLGVGQAVIVQQGRVLAIEAAEGTQAMIARSQPLIDQSTDGCVFIKMAKSHQDSRLDMPVIGLKTIDSLSRAGIKVIWVAAEKTMLADSLLEIEAKCQSDGLVLTTSLDFQSMQKEKADS